MDRTGRAGRPLAHSAPRRFARALVHSVARSLKPGGASTVSLCWIPWGSPRPPRSCGLHGYGGMGTPDGLTPLSRGLGVDARVGSSARLGLFGGCPAFFPPFLCARALTRTPVPPGLSAAIPESSAARRRSWQRYSQPRGHNTALQPLPIPSQQPFAARGFCSTTELTRSHRGSCTARLSFGNGQSCTPTSITGELRRDLSAELRVQGAVCLAVQYR